MSIRIVIVPVTNDQGNATISATDSYSQTVAQNALWQYNKMREHDGQEPLDRMPKGTKYLTRFAFNASKFCNKYSEGNK